MRIKPSVYIVGISGGQLDDFIKVGANKVMDKTIFFYDLEKTLKSFNIKSTDTILVIDDNDGARYILCIYLRKIYVNITIIEVKNPIEAINLFITDIDLIFIDNEMPYMSGLDFIKAIRNGRYWD